MTTLTRNDSTCPQAGQAPPAKQLELKDIKAPISLEFVKRTDSRYEEFRNRHYIPNRGSQGQQAHFLVRVGEDIAGIISGGSSVYAVASRDQFFGIPSEKEERERVWLPSIVNNTVFRLEDHLGIPYLGTRVLKLWRNTVATVWESLYGVRVIGFETFVIENETRVGTVYLADNWTRVGITAGRTKSHTTAGGMKDKRDHANTEKKIVLTRWAKRPTVPATPYVSSWRRSTPEERAASTRLAEMRAALEGRRFVHP